MPSGILSGRAARRLGVLLVACASLLAGGTVMAQTPGPAAVPDTSPYVVLITNADHGIGYEFARQYSERGWTVIATVRKPPATGELAALAGRWDSTIRVEPLDATSERSVRALAVRYQGQPIDLLINNMDLSGDPATQMYGHFDFREYDAIADANVKGPLRVIEALMDNVAASRQKKIMNISSAVGSIGLSDGGLLFYRSSKAALNMAIRTLSREIRRDPDPRRQALVFGLIDPGAEDAGTAGHPPATGLSPRASAEYCIAVIEGFTPESSGSFVDRRSTPLPW